MRTSRQRSTRKTRQALSLSKPTKLALNKWISSKADIKQVYSTPFSTGVGGGALTNDVAFNQSISQLADIYHLLPNVIQGLNSDQRVGNQIEPKSLRIQLALQLISPSAIVMPPTGGTQITYPENITVHLFFLRSRQVDDPTLVGNIPITQLMARSPEGLNPQEFDGSYWNSRLPINRAQFSVIKHIQVHMRKGNGWYSFVNNSNVTGMLVPPQLGQDGAYSSPDQAVKHMTISIPVPKKIYYANELQNQPKNYFPFMCVGWTKNEYPLSTPWQRDFFPLAISARTFFKFNDL
jgi:hypothetical protein